MSEDLKAIIKRSVEAWNTGDLTIVDEIFAKDYVIHHPSDPNLSDLDSYKHSISESRRAMPDLYLEIKDLITEDDKTVNRLEFSGTMTEEAFGIPATGKKATWTGISISRFKSGKIVETWVNEDTFGMLQQLGVIPAG